MYVCVYIYIVYIIYIYICIYYVYIYICLCINIYIYIYMKVYDKYACWCETTSNRKADNINQGTAAARVLGQTILKLKVI